MPHKKSICTKIGKIISVAITYASVALLWVPFRTNDIAEAGYIIKRMFSFENGISYIYDYSIIFVLLVLIIELIAVVKNNGNNPIKALDLNKFWNNVIIICFLIITFIFSYVGNTAFIYAQF